MNQELFRKVNDIITLRPREFEMTDWENADRVIEYNSDSPVCGTTRCLAGWAIHLTANAPLYLNGEHHPDVIALAKEVGAHVDSTPDGVESTDFEELGGILLGLNGSQRGIFYTSNRTAERFIEAVAEGDQELATEILSDRHN